jgi:hypothetical protein
MANLKDQRKEELKKAMTEGLSNRAAVLAKRHVKAKGITEAVDILTLAELHKANTAVKKSVTKAISDETESVDTPRT